MWGQGQGQGQGGWNNQNQQGFNGGQGQWNGPNQGFNGGQGGQGWGGSNQQGGQWNGPNQGFNGGQGQWNGPNQGFNGGQGQWNGPNQQGGQGGWGNHQNNNPFNNGQNKWGMGGFIQAPQWNNPNNNFIPPINFRPNCHKCHGNGMVNRRGMMIPCRACYKRNQICPKCYGSGFNYFTNKPCRKCQKNHGRWGGHRHGRRSSSSSS